MRAAHGLFERAGLVLGRDSFPKWLGAKAGKAPRTVEYWLADDRAMDLETFHRLCCADARFLDTFVDALPPAVRDAWLHDKLLEVQIANAERRAAEQRAEAEALKLQLRRA